MHDRKPRRILGYARVSSVEQALGTSLQDQQDAIRAYARSLGLEVTRMYVEAESAVHEKFERREQIRALMADARAGDLVVCHVLDRWSRDAEFTLRSVREMTERDVRFYAIQDHIDPSTPEGDTALGYRAIFAREEHKRIRVRTVGTRKLLRDRGYYADGHPPIGYRRQDVRGPERNILVIEPEGAELVRTIFALSIAGKSIADTVKLLHVERDLVWDTLRNRVYLGEVRNGRGEWIVGLHKPIVDALTFSRARDAIASRLLGERKPRLESETATWWLRDLTRCARCGGKMAAAYAGRKGSPNRRYYYYCKHGCAERRFIPVRPLEASAEPIVIERLEAIRAQLAIAKPAAPPKKPDDTASRLARIEAKRLRLADAFADGAFDRSELRKRLAALDLERTRVQGDAIVPPPPAPEARRDVLEQVGRMAAVFGVATPLERRAIVGAIARSCAIAFGRPPVFAWIEAEDLTPARQGA